MSLSVKNKIEAVRYDGFNQNEVKDLAAEVGYEVYPDSNVQDGHSNLVLHASYFYGWKTTDDYCYMTAGDWLVTVFGRAVTMSDDDAHNHIAGLPKTKYDNTVTHESENVTQDVDDAELPAPSHLAKSKPSDPKHNKFGDYDALEKEQEQVAAWDADMKAKGYTERDKAVDSRTGSTGPSATPGAPTRTPIPDELQPHDEEDEEADPIASRFAAASGKSETAKKSSSAKKSAEKK